ncbi:unnamed protein product, partial [Trichogramma brassicae]
LPKKSTLMSTSTPARKTPQPNPNLNGETCYSSRGTSIWITVICLSESNMQHRKVLFLRNKFKKKSSPRFFASDTRKKLKNSSDLYVELQEEIIELKSSCDKQMKDLIQAKTILELEIKNIVSTSVDSSDKLTKYSEDLREKEKELVESRKNLSQYFFSHLIQKTLPPPRVFCDICDEFDLHDTDDCPKQAQDPDEQLHNPSKTKKVLAQRPYCETCESMSFSKFIKRKLFITTSLLK